MIFATFFKTVMSLGERKREITLRLYWVQLFSTVTLQCCEAVLVSKKYMNVV